jgi:hypothetical protein
VCPYYGSVPSNFDISQVEKVITSSYSRQSATIPITDQVITIG